MVLGTTTAARGRALATGSRDRRSRNLKFLGQVRNLKFSGVRVQRISGVSAETRFPRDHRSGSTGNQDGAGDSYCGLLTRKNSGREVWHCWLFRDSGTLRRLGLHGGGDKSACGQLAMAGGAGRSHTWAGGAKRRHVMGRLGAAGKGKSTSAEKGNLLGRCGSGLVSLSEALRRAPSFWVAPQSVPAGGYDSGQELFSVTGNPEQANYCQDGRIGSC
jgi:hypothetical protein